MLVDNNGNISWIFVHEINCSLMKVVSALFGVVIFVAFGICSYFTWESC